MDCTVHLVKQNKYKIDDDLMIFWSIKWLNEMCNSLRTFNEIWACFINTNCELVDYIKHYLLQGTRLHLLLSLKISGKLSSRYLFGNGYHRCPGRQGGHNGSGLEYHGHGCQQKQSRFPHHYSNSSSKNHNMCYSSVLATNNKRTALWVRQSDTVTERTLWRTSNWKPWLAWGRFQAVCIR